MDNAWNKHGSENGKTRTERKLNTLQESQRKTEGPGATAFYAKKNRFVVPEDTHKNYDFVNDGQGGFREAMSVDETLDYGEYRVNRVKSKLADSNTTWITSVFHLPYDLCEEIPNYYPRLDDNGKQMINPDGTPAMRSRWVIAEGKEEEARRYFEEILKFFGDRVLAGGQAAIHGGSINLDESRPHLQIISDQFEADERSKDPDALKNGFSLAMGRHPRKSRRVPKFDKRTGEPIMLPDGTQKHGPEDASEKAERHHRELKQHMLDAGFNIESERDAKRHNRRLDNHDFQSLRDREAITDERTAAAEEATVDAELARYEIEGREEDALLDKAEAAETSQWLTDAWVEQEEPELRERAESEGYDAGKTEGREEWGRRYQAARKRGWEKGTEQARERYSEAVEKGNAYRDKKKSELDAARKKIKSVKADAVTKAVAAWEADELPTLRQKSREEEKAAVRAEMQPEIDAAATDRETAAEELSAVRERQLVLRRREAEFEAEKLDLARLKEQWQESSDALSEKFKELSKAVGGGQAAYRTLQEMGKALPTEQRRRFDEVTRSRFLRSGAALRDHHQTGNRLADEVREARSQRPDEGREGHQKEL